MSWYVKFSVCSVLLEHIEGNWNLFTEMLTEIKCRVQPFLCLFFCLSVCQIFLSTTIGSHWWGSHSCLIRPCDSLIMHYDQSPITHSSLQTMVCAVFILYHKCTPQPHLYPCILFVDDVLMYKILLMVDVISLFSKDWNNIG